MSAFIQVGVTAMRDPMTGEPLQQVPLYVEAEDGQDMPLPEFDRKQFAKDLLQKFRAHMTEEAKEIR